MKTLTKIRLINWHYFNNETIDVKKNILFTGYNASGKSTILDAITFVITAGDQKFNLAANEKGKRDLRSYTNCKLGAIDQKYLRNYDLTSHICLEFYSEKKEKYFCLGVVIDVVGEVQPPRVNFYFIDGEMKEEFFVNKDNVINDFTAFRKGDFKKEIYATKKEAKAAFKIKMGGVSDKYFTLLPKALAFKPIVDVKEYIYQHLLEEKNLDAQNARDSIIAYRELENILNTIKNQIADLKEINTTFYAIKDLEKQKSSNDYILKYLRMNNATYEIEKYKKEISTLESNIETKNVLINDINSKIAYEDALSKKLYLSLSQTKEFQQIELYDGDINRIKSDLTSMGDRRRELDSVIESYKESLNLVKNIDSHLYKMMNKVDFDLATSESISSCLDSLNTIKNEIKTIKSELLQKNAELSAKKMSVQEELSSSNDTRNQVQRNGALYKPEVIYLRDELEAHLKRLYNENINVHIYAEVIDIKDPSWQDAIEMFLGNVRYTLIVDPEYYDDCLVYYNKIKSRNLYGVNLLNTKKISQFDDYEPNSIASLITTDNIDARRYTNYITGHLIMVDDVKELEKYNQSITKQGMVYRGFVTRYLNPNIEKPLIGSSARVEQNKKIENTINELQKDLAQISREIQQNTNLFSILDSIDFAALDSLIKGELKYIAAQKQLENYEVLKGKLDSSSIDDQRKEYEASLKRISDLTKEKESYQVEIGSKRQEIAQKRVSIEHLESSISSTKIELEKIDAIDPTFRIEGDKVLSAIMNGEITPDQIIKDMNDKKSDIDTTLAVKNKQLVIGQNNYNLQYNKTFGTGFEENQAFIDEENKLCGSELIKYEREVRVSRTKTELLFKEDFLAKLNNYILEAQDEIQKINETLKEIVFDNDSYQFVFSKSKEYGRIYDMIMNGAKDGGELMMDKEFEREYKQELDELFQNLALDTDGSSFNLNKFTDYRTYMDYDIEIITKGKKFYYSDISKEKSGGETQIPFYVAILASFVGIFNKAEKNHLDDSIKLIMFDEVFDKMDDKRIEAMMDFINKLSIQVILACPPQKISAVSKQIQTTVVVCRDGQSIGTFSTIKKD